MYTIAQAMWFSVNTVYAQLILDPRVTVEATAETAKALGITSAWYSPQVHGASYALGSLDVSPLDMASAYGVFDNHGVRVPPTPIIRVENASGKTILDDSRPAGTPVLGPTVADNVTNVLTGVISQPGATAYGTGNIGRPAAGKTGTTSSYVDAWFVGYTPTLVTSVWMGKKNTEDPAKGASLDEVCSGGPTAMRLPGLRRDPAGRDVGGLHETGHAGRTGHQLQPAGSAADGRQRLAGDAGSDPPRRSAVPDRDRRRRTLRREPRRSGASSRRPPPRTRRRRRCRRPHHDAAPARSDDDLPVRCPPSPGPPVIQPGLPLVDCTGVPFGQTSTRSQVASGGTANHTSATGKPNGE